MLMNSLRRSIGPIVVKAGNVLPEFYRPVWQGILTWVPGAYDPAGTGGGTRSARYCYSVWLRHLVMARDSGLDTDPRVVAELGPGDSLGVGLAALLCGAHRYYAFDVVQHAVPEQNLEVLDGLVTLLEAREDIPDEDEFPKVKPYLNSYKFPRDALTDQRLRESMNPDRLQSIRRALADRERENTRTVHISYFAPWDDPAITQPESVDMVFSQAVLEHVDDLPGMYAALYWWLRPGGFMSHSIDFKSHGITREWNGHWKYSDFWWSLIRGKRKGLLNREPYSRHLHLAQQQGFQVVYYRRFPGESEIEPGDLAPVFRDMSDEDLTTRSAFIQAAKRK